MILANSDVGLYKFRGELIDSLLASGFEVVISLPDGEYIEALVQKGCRFLETPIDRRGTNPLRDAKLMGNYRRLLRAERPDVVLTYTVKPNVYGGLACGRLRIPYICLLYTSSSLSRSMVSSTCCFARERPWLTKTGPSPDSSHWGLTWNTFSIRRSIRSGGVTFPWMIREK